MLSPHSSNQELHMAEEMWWRGTKKEEKKWGWGVFLTQYISRGYPLLSTSSSSLPPSLSLPALALQLARFQICPPSSPHPQKLHLLDDWWSRAGGGEREMEGGTGGQWVRGRTGERERERTTMVTPPPPTVWLERRQLLSSPKRGGREEKWDLRSSSASNQHF